MHYVDACEHACAEDCPVVVCLHGNPTWSFYFRELIAALRSTHRVIAPDHIGCGRSDKPRDSEYSYTLARRVADVEALLEHLNVRNATFVLHDWGGMIGCALALRRPEMISRLVLLNTAAFLLPAGKRLPWRLWALRRIPLLPTLMIRGFNLFAAAATRMAVVRPLPREVREKYVEPYNSWANRIATLRFVQDIPLGPGHPSYELARWVDERVDQLRRLPTLVCWGRQDFVFNGAFLDEWRRRLPAADFRVFEDAGHYVLEDARDEVIAAIRAFAGVDPGVPTTPGCGVAS
ncbi:Haloalkane dehalogenase [Phycisphaerae bacterium RAS1]|nr:Haloalkane dehalogenase [Phycisphaerae bacterium RAS1]